MSQDDTRVHEDDIGCLEAIEALYAWLDGELDEETATALEHHLGHCRSCYSRREMELELSKRMQASDRSEASTELRDRLKTLLDRF